MNRSALQSSAAQALFDACLNVADKGQSQWFTPLTFGAACARLLPAQRTFVCDLTCGAGHLLQASANKSTTHLLGADVDAGPFKFRPEGGLLKRIVSEFTVLANELDDINWRSFIFPLNPPYGVSFKPERLKFLKNSDLPAVAMAFATLLEKRAAILDQYGGVDSGIAVLAAALHFCEREGEGFAICNHNTIQRLIFAAGAPFASLGRHIWLRVVLPGNPMTGLLKGNFDREYNTEVVYFARSHTVGPHRLDTTQAEWEGMVTSCQLKVEGSTRGATKNLQPSTLQPATALDPARLRAEHRQGSEVYAYQFKELPLTLWKAVGEELAARAGAATRHPYNLWLVDGVIRTCLSDFQKVSRKVDKHLAGKLHDLNGKRPMELVLQRNQRDNLLEAIAHGGWRVDPQLTAAVERAVKEYHEGRAPLYPLPEIQRLGYLDELDAIECKLDLAASDVCRVSGDGKEKAITPRATRHSSPAVIFQAGQKYKLRTQTVEITRKTTKPNSFTGEDEDIEFTGQQLAILITAAGGDEAPEYCFMDGALLTARDTTMKNPKKVNPNSGKSYDANPTPATVIDFTTEDIVRHFVIPEVPDVATLNPDLFQFYVQQIHEIEAALAEA